MKFRPELLPLLFLSLVCIAAQLQESDKSHTTITISSPDEAYRTGLAYIEYVAVSDSGLYLSGHLPDGCSKLHELSYLIKDDQLHLKLTSWKPRDAICTQALISFSHSEPAIPADSLQNLSHWKTQENSGTIHHK